MTSILVSIPIIDAIPRENPHSHVIILDCTTGKAQGRFTNIIRTPSKQWGVCDKFTSTFIKQAIFMISIPSLIYYFFGTSFIRSFVRSLLHSFLPPSLHVFIHSFQIFLRRAKGGYGFTVIGASPVKVSRVEPGMYRKLPH